MKISSRIKSRYLIIIVVCALLTCTVLYYKYRMVDVNDDSKGINFGISLSNADYNSGYYKLRSEINDYVDINNEYEYSINLVISDSLIWNNDYSDRYQDIYNQYLNIIEMIDTGADFLVVGIDNKEYEEKIFKYCQKNNVGLYLINENIESEIYSKQISLANDIFDSGEYDNYIYIGYNSNRFENIKNNINEECIKYINYNGDYNNLNLELEGIFDKLANSLILTEADSITYDLLRILDNTSIEEYKIISVGGNDYIKSRTKENKEVISIDWDYETEVNNIIEMIEKGNK